ncbi:MAG: septum formation protein Maf [Lentisphaerae bacterium]|jgi:septum formation protein|nr:septum formation protein Maf [Lentisphaerota bacterium]
MNNHFIAATASERRQRILKELGVKFSVFIPECEEIISNSDPVRVVATNALAKHQACLQHHANSWILAADTIVALSGQCLGKPPTAAEAVDMLMTLSGKTHIVFTGVAVSRPSHNADVRVAASSVTFNKFDEAAAREYLKAAKTHDRAGAYDIDACGDMIIKSYSGSRTNIMGLPAEIVRDWLIANEFPCRH